jgi:hypothetical protein
VEPGHYDLVVCLYVHVAGSVEDMVGWMANGVAPGGTLFLVGHHPIDPSTFAGFVNVTGDLAQGTKDNEALRVFTASGYYDLATAYFANAYMLHHSGIDPARVTIRNYPAGHMMYLNQGSLEQLSRDIGEFIQGK